MLKCKECGQVIKKCSTCGKLITGSYKSVGGKLYHVGCKIEGSD